MLLPFVSVGTNCAERCFIPSFDVGILVYTAVDHVGTALATWRRAVYVESYLMVKLAEASSWRQGEAQRMATLPDVLSMRQMTMC